MVTGQGPPTYPCHAVKQSIYHTINYKEENQLLELEGKISIIGREIDTASMGEFHLGLSNRQQVVDCTHWSMPGVTDLYAKEIMKSIVKVKEV